MTVAGFTIILVIMRGFFRAALMVLVLLVVAMISALTAMRIAIHGREVEVPKLVGLATRQAEGQAYQRGLRVEVEDRFYSAAVPEGRIMSQSPLPGTKVRRGWRGGGRWRRPSVPCGP